MDLYEVFIGRYHTDVTKTNFEQHPYITLNKVEPQSIGSWLIYVEAKNVDHAEMLAWDLVKKWWYGRTGKPR